MSEPPIAVGEERDDVTGEPINTQLNPDADEVTSDRRPSLDPEMAELVKEKRAANKDKPETVIDVDGRRLS